MVRHLYQCLKQPFNQICINPYPAIELGFLWGEKMPLPTAAELTDPNATNTQMKQRLGQLAENVADKKQVILVEFNALEISEKTANGGNYYYAKSASFTIPGYINTSGAFINSTAGYSTTDFIPINANAPIHYSINASSSVAGISFYDSNFNFLGYVKSNNVTTEKVVQPIANSKYIRVSNVMTSTPEPYVFASFESVLNNPSLLKTASLTIQKSENLANLSLLVNDAYVNNSGTITNGAGWKYIKIPVEAGKTYTFGRFLIDSAGYYAFHTAANTNIAGSNGSFQNNSLPKTVLAPASAAFLLIDIARPTNTATQYAQLTINEGETLIDYVEPVGVVTKIAGYKIAGVSSGGGGSPEPVGDFVEQNGNATLADLVADSVTTGALIANLPMSNVGLEVGQAYIDTATATIKVVM